MKTLALRTIVALAAFLVIRPALADNPIFAQGNKVVQTSIIRDIETFQPTASDRQPTARIAVRFTIEPGWHIYWKNGGEAGLPTKVEWSLPSGWRVGELQWPAPLRFIERGGIVTYGYEDEVVLIAEVFNPPEIPAAEGEITVSARASWLVCKEICVPGEREMNVSVPYSITAPLQPSADIALLEKYSELVPKSLPEIMSLDGLHQFGFQATSKFDSSDGATNLYGGILLRNLDSAFAKTIEKHIQVFPNPDGGIVVGGPEIGATPVPTEAGAGAAEGRSYFIRFPIRTSSASTDMQSARGVIVLSSQLARATHDVSFEWVVPIPSSGSAEAAKATKLYDELASGIVNYFPLVFRQVSHDEPKKEASQEAGEALNVISVNLPTAIAFAFFAGFILNFMPCVLPVVSLKTMTLLEAVEDSRRQITLDSLTFAAGILSTFAVLATFVIVLRGQGAEIMWGSAFQHPEFIFALLVVVFFLTLASFDLYIISLPGLQAANKAASNVRGRAAKHFFDGVLATVLSTPCTAPFLGTAIGFALTQPAIVTMIVFLSIGLGLSLPYVILAAAPQLIRFLPRPGEWMNRLRQVMGFLLLGTALWLLFILNNLTDDGGIWALVILFVIFFAVWVNKWIAESTDRRAPRRVGLIAGIAAVVLVTSLLWSSVSVVRTKASAGSLGGISWIPYSEQVLIDERAKGNPVFIDFTADWCITCKFNERTTLAASAVQDAIRSSGVTPVKADLTSRDPVLTAALKRFGGQGLPYYVLIPGTEGEPVILPTLLTQGAVLDGLKQVARDGKR